MAWSGPRRRCAANAPARPCARPRWCDSWPRASRRRRPSRSPPMPGCHCARFIATSGPSTICCLPTTPVCIGFGLHWFRAALDARPVDEAIIDSVQTAIFAFPYDVEAVAKIATLRGGELDPSRIVRHIQEVQADFAEVIAAQLLRRSCAAAGTSAQTPDARVRTAVTARCIAAAVFGAMEVWMLGEDRSLGELARVCQLALETSRAGLTNTWCPDRPRTVSS